MSTPAPREGSRVSYVGHPGDGMEIGDRGKVLSQAGSGSHVLWSTGKRAGDITLVAHLDVVEGAQPVTYDDLDSGSLVTFAVRDVFERQGQVGLLNTLNEEGHLATLAGYVEEAISLVSARLSSDPSFSEVLASLDPQDGADFVAFTASVLMRDAFTTEAE